MKSTKPTTLANHTNLDSYLLRVAEKQSFHHLPRYLGKKKLVVGLTESVPEMKKPKFKGLLLEPKFVEPLISCPNARSNHMSAIASIFFTNNFNNAIYF
jgi:hypothetical protein